MEASVQAITISSPDRTIRGNAPDPSPVVPDTFTGAAGAPFAGRSVVVDPWGEVVAEAGAAEEVLRAEVDVARVAKIRSEFPVLDDRRIDVGGR